MAPKDRKGPKDGQTVDKRLEKAIKDLRESWAKYKAEGKEPDVIIAPHEWTKFLERFSKDVEARGMIMAAMMQWPEASKTLKEPHLMLCEKSAAQGFGHIVDKSEQLRRIGKEPAVLVVDLEKAEEIMGKLGDPLNPQPRGN